MTLLISSARDELLASHSPQRPNKRARIDDPTPDSVERFSRDEADSYDDSSAVVRHPLGVRPSGNAWTSTENLKSHCGSLSLLPDELLAQFLESLHAPDLLRLGGTCRALHAFTRNEELWRALFVETQPIDFRWRGTWRSTYLAQDCSREPRVDCSNLFSDVLHRPFFCANVSLDRYAENIPERNKISRLEDMSEEDFQEDWVTKPFILTRPVREWLVYQTWSTDRLVEKFGQVTFRAESVDWPLAKYISYMDSNHDESPLYLFDRSFVESMNLKVSSKPDPNADYWPPVAFGFDLFSLLGQSRPDHRWLIVGPARSGSTFHKDPNATSAWNAVIKGSKYWIMFPSSSSLPPPPGVYVSEDQSEVTSPLSIAEWLLGFHAEARRTPGCVEAICHEGEILHVPSGWYHLVLNLEPSIALTQNFVPLKRLGAVLQFLRDQKQSISGFRDDVTDPYQLFVDRLRDYDEEILQKGVEELDRLTKGARGRWEALKTLDDDENGPGLFSFGFGGDDDEDDSDGVDPNRT